MEYLSGDINVLFVPTEADSTADCTELLNEIKRNVENEDKIVIKHKEDVLSGNFNNI